MPQQTRYIFGIHGARAILDQKPDAVRRVLIVSNYRGRRLHELRQLAESRGIRAKSVPRANLDRLSKNTPHQGIAVEVAQFQAKTEKDLEALLKTRAKPLILALDSIQDPRNLGACLRTADGAGVDAVIIGKHRCAPLSETVQRTSTGALDSVFLVHVNNLVRTLDSLRERGCWIVGSSGNSGISYTSLDYAQATVLVLGGEEKGLRTLTLSKCDHVVSIPMRGHASSLNVAVAAGILLYEISCQREGLGRA